MDHPLWDSSDPQSNRLLEGLEKPDFSSVSSLMWHLGCILSPTFHVLCLSVPSILSCFAERKGILVLLILSHEEMSQFKPGES